MTSRRRILARVSVAIGVVVLGFPLLQDWVRQTEIFVSVRLLRALQLGDRVTSAEHSVVLKPDHEPIFRAALTPACSSLAAVLALGCLGVLTRGHRWPRRAAALGTAIAAVVIGNTLRVVGSLVVGIEAGRSSLVLFHDVAGSAFTFAYIIGGYVILLSYLLRKPTDGTVGAAVLRGG